MLEAVLSKLRLVADALRRRILAAGAGGPPGRSPP
jgi:hypothetical protein